MAKRATDPCVNFQVQFQGERCACVSQRTAITGGIVPAISGLHRTGLHTLRKHTARNGRHCRGGEMGKDQAAAREEGSQLSARPHQERVDGDGLQSGSLYPLSTCHATSSLCNTLDAPWVDHASANAWRKSSYTRNEQISSLQTAGQTQMCIDAKSATRVTSISAAGIQQGNYTSSVPPPSSGPSDRQDNKDTRLKHSAPQVISYFNVMFSLFSDESIKKKKSTHFKSYITQKGTFSLYHILTYPVSMQLSGFLPAKYII